MTAKERLSEYVKQDIVYNRYKENPNQEFSDFEKFCIQHCKDIEQMLKENKKLYKLCDMLDEEHKTYFEIWKKGIENNKIV